jgi:sphingomyelin phosphodiesterase acid-like 3
MVTILRSLNRSIFSATILLALLSVRFVPASSAQAQQLPVQEKQTIRALFISDIHFDPFHDPGKARQLDTAPVSEWRTILASSPSGDQRQAFESLQERCGGKGVDTPPELMRSLVAAMKAQNADAKFIMVSGDLVVHDFACRYHVLFPDAPSGAYQAFVLKTVSYVESELRGAFPDIPIYAALGNNDSGCADYQLDPDSDFFASVGGTFASGLPAAEARRAKKEFAAEGNYAIMMALPMKNTRLLVLDDTFLSPKYKTCSGKKSSVGADDEVAWLRSQLADARKAGERVWVMGHIPPGIDPYSTAEKLRNICGGQDAVMFMTSEKVPDLLVEYADVVKLGIFAHTHMDEIRLLRPESPGAAGVAIKMIPSVSPVHGNYPSFTVASINPSSASMQDYTVIAASNLTGIDTKWTPEYNYAHTYHQSDFSPSALNAMIARFRSDKSAALPESNAYLRNYFPGNRAAELSPFWMQYTCGLNNYTDKAYADCVCHAGN